MNEVCGSLSACVSTYMVRLVLERGGLSAERELLLQLGAARFDHLRVGGGSVPERDGVVIRSNREHRPALYA